MKILNRLSIAVLVIVLFYIIFLLFTKDNNEVTDNQLTFNFIHNVGEETMELDTIRYHSAYGNIYSVATLKYFISNITLHNADGEEFLFDEEHYVDVTDINTLSFTPNGRVLAGKYSKLSFIFGLDLTKNTTGRFPNPPENKMEWPVVMGGGYHYLKLEGKHYSSGLIKSFQAHSGQLNGEPYFVNITLPESSFDVDGKDLEIQIIMDINKMWVNPDTLNLNNITGIMGDSTIQWQLHENGADIFSFGLIQ